MNNDTLNDDDTWNLFIVADRLYVDSTTSAFTAAEWAASFGETQTVHGLLELPRADFAHDVMKDPPELLLYELTSFRFYIMPTSTPVEHSMIMDGDPYSSITGYFSEVAKGDIRELSDHIQDYDQYRFLFEGQSTPPDDDDSDADGGAGASDVEIDWSSAVEISPGEEWTPDLAWDRLEAQIERNLPEPYDPVIERNDGSIKASITLDEEFLVEDGFEMPKDNPSFLGELIDRAGDVISAVTSAVTGGASTVYKGVNPGGTEQQETVRRFGEGVAENLGDLEDDPNGTFESIIEGVETLIRDNIPFIGDFFDDHESAMYFQQSVVTFNMEIDRQVYDFDGHTETFIGLSGSQIVRLGSGDDLAAGGLGNDRLFGEGGRDELFGGSGRDKLFGGQGADELYGGRARDRLVGQNGEDLLNGGGGNDVLKGGSGNDRLLGGKGRDKLFGQNGEDVLKGGAARDTLKGGNGNDEIDGGRGWDVLWGGRGADDFVFGRRDGRDVIRDFAVGRDEIDLSGTGLDLSDIGLSFAGRDTVIEFARTTVILDGVRRGEIDDAADLFIF